jgi:subtilase family serine protease
MTTLRTKPAGRFFARTEIAMVCAAAIAAFAMVASAATTAPSASDERAEALAELSVPAASRQLKMAAILKLHDRAGIDQLIREQQDPASPSYHRWLTPEEFAQRFGPSSAEIDRVANWLRSKGFVISSASAKSRTVVFQGATDTAARAFEVKFAATPDSKIFANTKEPSLPPDIGALVEEIRGLDNMHQAFPQVSTRSTNLTTTPNAKVDLATAFGPQDIYSFYDETPLLNNTPTPIDGRNTDCLAVVEDSNFDKASVDAFNTQFNLPAFNYSLTPGTNFHYIFADLTDPGILSGGAQIESLLDLEYAHTVAPGATIVNYIGDDSNSFTGLGFLDATLDAIAENRCGTISISFGICGGTKSFYRTIDSFFAQAATQGQSIFIATGDEGAAKQVFRPRLNACAASKTRGIGGLEGSPNITAVGGTMFDPVFDSNGNNVGSVAESVWNDGSGAGGGGKSAIFKKPDYQQQATPKDHFRDVPDISFAGSPNSPGFFLGASGTVECCIGGTSIGAPSWAGISMLIQQENAGRVGLLNLPLYAIAPSGASAGLRDVVSGNNSFNGVKGYTAVLGFDLASGFGTPDIAELVQALLAAISSSSISK